VRNAGVLMTIVFAVAVAAEVVFGGSGRISVPAAVAMALISAGFACVGAGYWWRCGITLGNGVLTVTSPLRTYRVAVQDIECVRRGKYALAFDLYDGRRVISRSLEFGYLDPWLRDDAQCEQVVADVSAAAEQARGHHQPIAVDAAVIRGNRRRRANAQNARIAVGLVAVAVLLYAQPSNGGASNQKAAAQPARPAFVVGECIQDPSTANLDIKQIPCTSSHTAQVFSIVDTASGDATCDSSLIMSGRVSQNYSVDTMMTTIGNTPKIICIIITPPIAQSVVRGSH
jgi:hypothetical protein